MRVLALSLVAMLLAACATTPPPRPPEGVFNDQLFSAPTTRIGADDIFALSDEMKRYLDQEIAPHVRGKALRQSLVDAVTASGRLKLDYDAMTTRNAAETFAARSGNCLSLVIMTAAFAKALDIPVTYQSVYADETVGRTGNIQFSIGHVNLNLGERQAYVALGRTVRDTNMMTIDFLPPREAQGLSTRPVTEEAIIAMFMNNRAAEMLVQNDLDSAYWWTRAAIRAEPRFLSAYNTLGVVYQRHGNLELAEKAFLYILEREPANTRVMANLARLYERMGRTQDAQLIAAKLEALEPNPPFKYFNLGMNALRNGNPQMAKDMFAKEVDRMPYYHEFRYWLGVAYMQLGDNERASKQFALAVEYATTRDQHDLYAAKLARIKSTQIH